MAKNSDVCYGRPLNGLGFSSVGCARMCYTSVVTLSIACSENKYAQSISHKELCLMWKQAVGNSCVRNLNQLLIK